MASGSHLGDGIPLMRSGSSKSTKPTKLDVVRAAEVPCRARGRQKATTHGVDVIELKDGKIARMTSYANGRLDALIAEPSG